MPVRDDADVREEVQRLAQALALREREAAEKERQLERYAADLAETYRELKRSYTATVRTLSNWVEARDAYLGKHAERVTAYGLEIARAFGLPPDQVSQIEFGFLLHDIGKVAIPDAILFKPGPLNEAERALMTRHPVIGAEIIGGIEFLAAAVEVVRSHHERWDGSGYPDGLAGEDIPLAARIFMVGDVLDALTTRRPYREPSPLPVAREMIVAGAGTHFDPQVIEALRTISDETFARIAEQTE